MQTYMSIKEEVISQNQREIPSAIIFTLIPYFVHVMGSQCSTRHSKLGKLNYALRDN
jgi:hypothetical protein